ncbi:MAG: hypothetical protein ACYCZW_01265 [Minisyncoccota bacterium]
MAGYENQQPCDGVRRIDMKNTNERGIYPSVMMHHSSYCQLAIGGAMLTHFHQDEEEASCYQCTPTGCSGWRTRFDGGNGPGIQDLPCDLVAMYVEGQINISGYEGAYDSEEIVAPLCFAVVVFRSKEEKDYKGKVVREAREEYIYLWSHFGFTDRVRHDAVYDLKDAFEVARKGGPTMTFDERLAHSREIGWDNANSEREWHLVGKGRVPGRIRQLLHRTVNETKRVVDKNFGQGGAFFKLPQKKK